MKILIAHLFTVLAFSSWGQIHDSVRINELIYNSQEFAYYKKIDEAILCIDSIIEIDSSAKNYYYRGFVNNKAGRYQNALPDYTKAMALDPSEMGYVYSRGLCYYDMGQNSLSAEDFKICIKLDPLHKRSHNNLGLSYFKSDQFEKALACYEKAIEISPDYEIAYSNKGKTLVSLKRFGEAIDTYKKMVEVSPTVFSYNAIAKFSIGLGAYVAASEYYSEAIALESTNVHSLEQRAYCYLLREETENACVDFKVAAELGGEYAKRMLEEYCK